MGLPDATRIALQAEWIKNVSDLGEFKKDTWNQVVINLKRPDTKIGVNNPNVHIRGPTFTLGAMSLSRMKVVAECVRYHTSVGRVLAAQNMTWTVLEYFQHQWEALLEVKENQTEKNLPKLTKQIKAMKWVPTMLEFWSTQVGSRNVPLDYVVRDEVIPTPAAPTLLHNLP